MIIPNFELDITSPTVAGDTEGDAPSGLIWQPTLTLWLPGETARAASGASAAEPPREPVAAASRLLPTPLAVMPATVTHAVPWRARYHLSIGLLLPASAAALSWLPWEELSSVGYYFVGLFAILVMILLGATAAGVKIIWHATSQSVVRGGSALGCGIARGFALLLPIAASQFALFTCAPRLIELDRIAQGIVPTGNYQIGVTQDGTELEIDGAIGIGLGKQVARLLDANPTIQTVQINSQGGSTHEARKLRDLIDRHKLSTATADGCHNECTLAYLAGTQRRLGEDATVGFDRESSPALPQWARWLDYERDRRDWLARGVSPWFVDQALGARDSGGWQPSRSELMAAHIVNPAPAIVVAPSVQEVQEAPQATASVDRELLRARLFALLKEREPEGYRQLIDDIHAGLQSVTSVREFQPRIHPMARAVTYERLSHAEDTLLLDHAKFTLEQISLLYSQSANVCNRYFGMDWSGAVIEMAKYFPEEMLAKEASLMVDVLRSSATKEFRPPAKSTIERRWQALMTRIAKRYGAQAVQFFEFRRGTPDSGQTCHVLYEFYNGLVRLPDREAGALLRYHYGQLRARSLAPITNQARQVASNLPAAVNRRSVQ